MARVKLQQVPRASITAPWSHYDTQHIGMVRVKAFVVPFPPEQVIPCNQ